MPLALSSTPTDSICGWVFRTVLELVMNLLGYFLGDELVIYFYFMVAFSWDYGLVRFWEEGDNYLEAELFAFFIA